jgi:hypothetical protein
MMMTGERAGQPRGPGLRPEAGLGEAERLDAPPGTGCVPCCPPAGRAGGGSGPSALWGWSPPDLPADTPLKRRIDRLLPRSGVPAAACFAAVIGLLILAPQLPVRADLAADGLAALAGGAWCGLNFWRCRHAHCAVTGAGWLALSALAFFGAGLGHSLIGGYEQPVFLAVLAAALAFEAAWRWARGTSAVAPGAAPARQGRAPAA